MKVKARIAKSAILNRNGLNHLQIEILPPKPEQLGDKKPVCIVFALDRSGSMDDMAVESFVSYDGYPANQRINYIQQPMTPTMWPSSSAGTSNRTYFESGSFSHFKPIPAERSTKINYAQDAIIKFLDLLGPNDKIGIVSFDDIAFVEQELTNICDQSVKRSVISNIRSISPRGCTNISDALNVSRSLFTEEVLSEYNCKIILLSDGAANRGVYDVDGLASIALKCANSGITISSLGIGLDYDSTTMGEIARSGNGLFHYINDLSKLETIFQEELQLTNTVTAKNVKLYINIPDLIEVSENLNGYTQTINKDSIEVNLGDISRPRKVVFEIRNNFVDEIGDSQGAASVFATSSARIEGVSHTYTSAGSSITSAMASLDHLGALYARNAVSVDMVKEMYATGYIESRQ